MKMIIYMIKYLTRHWWVNPLSIQQRLMNNAGIQKYACIKPLHSALFNIQEPLLSNGIPIENLPLIGC